MLLEWTNTIPPSHIGAITAKEIAQAQEHIRRFLKSVPSIKSTKLSARLHAISPSKYHSGPVRVQGREGKVFRLSFQQNPKSPVVVVEVSLPEYRRRGASLAAIRGFASKFNHDYFPHWSQTNVGQSPTLGLSQRGEDFRQTKPNGIHGGRHHSRTFL